MSVDREKGPSHIQILSIIYIDRYLSHLGFILFKSDKTFDLSELPHIPYTLDNLFR